MKPNKVHLTQNARKCSKTIPLKSYLAFKKCIQKLRQNGCLSEEIPLTGDRLFAFAIDGDWVAVAQRQECRNWRGSRIFKIGILDLIPASQFQPPSNRLTIEITPREINWMKTAIEAIAPLLDRPHLPALAGVLTATAIAIFAVGYNDQSKVNLKMETDGTKVNGEFTIDGRQPQ